VRVDLRQFAVVKIEYDRAYQFGECSNGARAQLAFAF
jgi:hypothetical protein